MSGQHVIKPALLALVMSAAPAGFILAQDPAPAPAATEPEDAGFLERLIQNALGGEGRTVRVSGLEGLLSSEARIALIEVSDDDGVWLTVRDVVLDWRRLALIRGRLEVNALTVGTVNLARPPLPAPSPPPNLAADPDAKPEPFALPELPVAVNVANLAIGGLRLGAPVLGQQADLSITGDARLEGGEGALNLALVRIDGQEASFGLAAGFENETRRLFVDLGVNEAADGLITTLAGIPGTPPLEFSLKGDAPISDFLATLALRTDGQDRLAGTVALQEVPVDGAVPDRLITADIGGDVAALFLPDYRSFFGNSIELDLVARQGNATGLDIETLRLETQGMHLAGRVDLTPEFLPSVVDLTANLGTRIGLPVVLPLPGPALLVQDADLTLRYNEAVGDVFNLAVTSDGVMRTDGLLIDRLAVKLSGQLLKTDPAVISGVTARLSGGMTGFASTDRALWDAVGDAVTVDGDIAWSRGAPLDLQDLKIVAGDVSASGTARVTGLETNAIAVDTALAADVTDLARFSGISGQALGGTITADLTAQYDTVTGAGAVDLTGQTRDLTIGDREADGLLTGPVDLEVKAGRQAEGIVVDKLMLDGERITLNGNAIIAPDYWPHKVALTGRIGNPAGGVVSLPLPGAPTDLQSADIDLQYDAETGDAFALDIEARNFQQEGQVAVDRLILKADGTLAREDGVVQGALLTVSGDLGGINAPNPDLAEILADGARLSGSLDWTADGGVLNVPGFHLESGDLHADLTAAATKLGADDIEGSGSIDLTTGSLARFSALAGRDLRGSLIAQGRGNFALETGFFNVNATADGRDLAVDQPDLDKLLAGAPRLVAQGKRDEDGLRIEEFLVETDELNLSADGSMIGEVIRLRLDGGLRDLGVFVDGFPGPLTVGMDAVNKSETWTVAGTVAGPGGAEAKVEGDALRPDGTMDLRAKGSLPLGLANRFIVPRTIAGNLGFELRVDGAPGLDAISGTATIAGARVADPATRLALEDLGLKLGLADSRATIDLGGNLSSGGRVEVSGPVTLTGNMPADLTATLTRIHLVDPSLYDINLGGRIGIQGPLTGGAAISGRIDIGRSELKIPAGLGGAGAVPDVVHVNETAQSLKSRRRAGLIVDPAQSSSGGGGGPAFPLDILISAPQQIYVRGRGLDVEMGGQIQISGTTAAPVPTGSLQLIRGRLALLARRLDFETAEISLQGDLEPDIRMVASSDNGDIVARIVIEGPASDPELKFTSQPDLPEDEVLAQLFFGKPLQDLTPLELAQLASAINTLTGGGGGLFGKLRDGLGVDDLSVATDKEGTTSVSAGKYISERVYTDVTFGSDGTSEVQLNYEIKKDFTARGSFDNQGDTGIGFHYERDY
ncbi:MAG: translocation/assembly module TamB domain-containing protein [Rhodobacteraceae bacterium]|nr:translocation/assembly module TamB domain-containing protein [Paracoccaceae bacterium]